MDSLLLIENLKKDFITKTETLNILNGVNLRLEYGETISITGESGSGKSTFLNMIGGLDCVTSGSVKIDGVEISNLDENDLAFFRNKKIGFIFQSHYLLEEFTAIENVTIPYLMNDFNKKRAREKAEDLLERVGLSHRKKHYPSELSGGERQRVAIARAFVNTPSLILADEPTGNLDEKNAEKVLEILFDMTEKCKFSLILVTHSTSIAKMTKKHFHLERGVFVKTN